jgi:predicted dehydrogenase
VTAPAIRIGVLGAARVAALSVVPHALASGAQVVAIASRDLARAQRFAETHGVPHAHGDYGELLRRPDIDLVHVALPPALHAPWTLAALAEGKAVLCEKPFARDATEAGAMVEAAARAGLPLIEAFHYRFHPLMGRIESIVASGALGRLLQAEAVFDAGVPAAPGEFRWAGDLGGGALMDLGCYPVHLLRTLSGGEPSVRHAQATLEGAVDARTQAALAFPSGLEARIACSMAATTFRADLTLTGEAGELQVRNFVVPHLGARLGWGRSGAWREETCSPRASFAFQLDHVVAVMRGERPLTGGADAIANMSALEAIRAACKVRPG